MGKEKLLGGCHCPVPPTTASLPKLDFVHLWKEKLQPAAGLVGAGHDTYSCGWGSGTSRLSLTCSLPGPTVSTWDRKPHRQAAKRASVAFVLKLLSGHTHLQFCMRYW